MMQKVVITGLVKIITNLRKKATKKFKGVVKVYKVLSSWGPLGVVVGVVEGGVEVAI